MSKKEKEKAKSQNQEFIFGGHKVQKNEWSPWYERRDLLYSSMCNGDHVFNCISHFLNPALAQHNYILIRSPYSLENVARKVNEEIKKIRKHLQEISSLAQEFDEIIELGRNLVSQKNWDGIANMDLREQEDNLPLEANLAKNRQFQVFENPDFQGRAQKDAHLEVNISHFPEIAKRQIIEIKMQFNLALIDIVTMDNTGRSRRELIMAVDRVFGKKSALMTQIIASGKGHLLLDDD